MTPRKGLVFQSSPLSAYDGVVVAAGDLRAGLYDDALKAVDDAAQFYRETHRNARLSDALYLKGDTLENAGDHISALAALSAARELNLSQSELLDVAFDDQKIWDVELELQRVESAGSDRLSRAHDRRISANRLAR